MKHYRFGFMHVIVNASNGEIRYFENETDHDSEYEIFLYQDETFYRPVREVRYSIDHYSRVTLSINLSTKCNFSCRYCFADHSVGQDFKKMNHLREIIETFVRQHRDKKVLFVDLSGSGEPLLHLKEIVRIAKFCRRLSEVYSTSVVVQFVTNGYLLTEKTVEVLQKNAVLFGVSVDGTRENHDKNRVLADGRGTYDVVRSNLMRIKEKQYLGVSMVLDGTFSGNLLETYLNLLSFAPTISVKFKRSECAEEFKEAHLHLAQEYFGVALYLSERILEEDYALMFAMLNGDDAFGTMISRVFIGNKVFARCDGGIARFSYDIEGEVYPCAPSCGDKRYKVEQGNTFYADWFEKDYCENCECKYYCGGECPIVKERLKGNDPYLCKIRRKLFEYGLWLKAFCLAHKPEGYTTIRNFIFEKETR